MQATLFNLDRATDQLWFRAAIRECIAYGEHGIIVQEDEHGHSVCFNCQGRV